MKVRKIILKAVEYITTIIFGSILITVITLGIYFNEILEIPSKIFIPKGSIAKIISHIDKEIPAKFYPIDKYVVAHYGQPQSGWIHIPKNKMRRIDFLKLLTEAKAPPSTKMITLIPSETTKYFLYSLAKKYHKNGEELFQYYLSISPLKEGFLIPDSYYMNTENDLKKFIKKIVNHSKQIHSKEMKKYNLHTLDDLRKVLTVASIIEKESASKEEMPIISSVIYNRLNRKMKLQMDGTLNYGLYSHIKITAKRIREDKSDYNTYKITGLPQNPICNPSSEAIKSAVYPQDTRFLYFVIIKNQRKHIFSRTYKKHLEEVNKLK